MKQMQSMIESDSALRRGLRFVGVFCLGLLFAGAAWAQPLALDAAVVSSGGGEATASALDIGLAVGQPVVGTTSGGTLRVELGLLAGGAMVNVSTGDDAAPLRFALGANYPNPFVRTTKIAYELPEAASVRLEVFDVLGRRVRTLVDGEQSAGWHTVEFVAEGLASGVYLYRLTADARTTTRQMHVIR
jgi:hypothetical protein